MSNEKLWIFNICFHLWVYDDFWNVHVDKSFLSYLISRNVCIPCLVISYFMCFCGFHIWWVALWRMCWIWGLMCGVVDGWMKGIMRMMGDLNSCEKLMAQRRFGRRVERSPKCSNRAISKAVRSSGPHPEAHWLEPTFRSAQASLTRASSLKRTWVHSSKPLPESPRLVLTSGSLEPTACLAWVLVRSWIMRL